MNVIINQFAGLGDILFIEPIYRHYHNRGFKVIAPVNPDSLWIQEYIPYVEFKDKTKYRYSYETVEQPEDGQMHLPLRFAHPLLRGYDLHYGDERQHWMPDKYTYLGLPVELWKTLSFNRNKEREERLFKSLNLPKDYIFINQNFGGSFEKININIQSSMPIIEMQKIEGYTMLDWGKVIENATEVHTAETSLLYYIESLKFKGEKHLYPRFPFMDSCEYMNTILTDWVFHTKDDLI